MWGLDMSHPLWSTVLADLIPGHFCNAWTCRESFTSKEAFKKLWCYGVCDRHIAPLSPSSARTGLALTRLLPQSGTI